MSEIPFEYKRAFASSMLKNPPAIQMKEFGMSDSEINETMRLWDEAARESKGIGPDYDYGAYSGNPDSKGHIGDVGKLYTHPTFSNESMYSDPSLGLSGGSWTMDEKGVGTFMPSPRQIQIGLGRLQWMVNNGYNDGDIYLGADGKPLVKEK